jgi:hypothetical protein
MSHWAALLFPHLLCVLRRGYLSMLPRLTSALLCKHMPNTESTAMDHLDRKRQGLNSNKLSVASSTMPTTTLPTTYEDDPTALSDSPDSDTIVYTSLFHTADFDLTGRFPVQSVGARNIYHLVSCCNGYIHVEHQNSRPPIRKSEPMRPHISTGPNMGRSPPSFVLIMKPLPTEKNSY